MEKSGSSGKKLIEMKFGGKKKKEINKEADLPAQPEDLRLNTPKDANSSTGCPLSLDI